jgi:hypothetical protein
VKAIILLAVALFLATAPEPDSEAISDMTAHFIVLDQPAHLQAAEEPVRAARKTAEKPENGDAPETDLTERASQDSR